MRHEDAGLSLWLAAGEPSPDRADECERALAVARAGADRASIRLRVGEAVIAFGERLAGEPRQRPVGGRRLAGHAS